MGIKNTQVFTMQDKKDGLSPQDINENLDSMDLNPQIHLSLKKWIPQKDLVSQKDLSEEQIDLAIKILAAQKQKYIQENNHVRKYLAYSFPVLAVMELLACLLLEESLSSKVVIPLITTFGLIAFFYFNTERDK
jgi:hypothetical protein